MARAVQNNPDNAYLDRLTEVDFQPVFVIGPHRSGTTILYKTLMETGCFNVTTAYHVINHPRLLSLHFNRQEPQARAELIQLFESKGLKDREFDSIRITPEIPEEYCFALEPQGRRPVLSPKSLRSFIEFCKKVQLIQNPDKPLLLKNPFDTMSFVYIYRMFPKAKFIFIYRHPADVINSQMKTIRSILERKNEYVALVNLRYRQVFDNPIKLALARWIYSGPLPILFYQVSHYLARNCDYVLQNVDRLRQSAHGLTYHEFCQRPNLAIRAILDFVGLQESAPRDYSSLIQPRASTPLPIVVKHRAALEKRNEDYCRRFGV